MASKSLSAGTDYTSTILHSIREMTETSDFTIKVTGQSFPVHRNVITAASSYFRAMFSSNMKEAQQGFADVKTVKPAIMEKCIDFMYTGEVKVQMDEIQGILHASSLLQLDSLTELSFEYLQKNLSVNNCLVAAYLAKLYDRVNLLNTAEQIVYDKFDEVVSTDTFAAISCEDITRYLSKANANHEIKWKAIVTWLSIRQEEVERVLPTLLNSIKNISVNFFLETILNESMMFRKKQLVHFIVDRLLSSIEEIIKNISLENFMNLRKILNTQKIKIEGQVVKVMNDFMAENFEQLAERHDFAELNEEEIFFLFRSPKIKCSSERIKWYAALKWSKNHPNEKKVFPKLFKLMKLHDLSLDFIGKVVRTEPLVRNSHECTVMLMDAFSAHGSVSKHPSSVESPTKVPSQHIVFLNKKNGQVNAWSIMNKTWHRLPKVKLGEDMQIVNVNNDLYVSSESELFHWKEDTFWSRKSYIRDKSGYCKLVACQGNLYLVQRYNMQCYDSIRNNYKNSLPGCVLGYGFCAVATRACIYAMGGLHTDQRAEKFNPVTKTWSRLSPMLNPRHHAAAVEFNGKIYVIGGEDGECISNSVESYNFETNTWTEVASMCVPRWDLFAVADDKNIFAVGENADGSTNSVDVYDPNSNHWSFTRIDGIATKSLLTGCVCHM
uniref:LOW QUALITY PROTEIN: kelch-like protein 12 n=1 Tax=Styela clava TaxID=7725 RepID=UPI00193A4884|nr:LOW QUALITY PROTEIN: kelch-like protein 12 [Styela clava]